MACTVSSLTSRVPSAASESPAIEPTELAALCQAVAAARTLSVWALRPELGQRPGQDQTVSPGPIAESGVGITMSSNTGSGANVGADPFLCAEEWWSARTKLLAV